MSVLTGHPCVQGESTRFVHNLELPPIIQGGMGIAVSSWQLAGAVARAGHLGVVSGTGLETVYARRLQQGDPGGHVRRAFGHFPIPAMAQRILDRYFVSGGIGDGPFKAVPMYSMQPPRALEELSVVCNFAEVFLARERGRGGAVGINDLFKISMPLLGSLYGAMLAGVDTVIVGAGSPAQVPALLDKLAAGEDAALALRVQHATSKDNYEMRFSPRELMGDALTPLTRPRFLAIVASSELAASLAAEKVAPDGFIVEGHVAGGHNAPPRGPLDLDDQGQPRYGPADEVDLAQLAALNKPFWLAGSFGTPAGLSRALALGATGIQVGTAFALCEESRVCESLKSSMLARVRDEQLRVKTDPRSSPTGFPFKVAQVAGSLSEDAVYAQRERICDIGLLRTPFKTKSGSIGYRCPAEKEAMFVRKGGWAPNTAGRMCLCSGLLATVGLGAARRGGYREPALITLGDHVEGLLAFMPEGKASYSAADVIASLMEQPAASFIGPRAA